MNRNSYEYPGSELEVFSEAHNWKQYVRTIVGPYIGQQVIEVGAGIGATTAALCSGQQSRWICLEPDARLASVLEQKIRSGLLPACCEARVATVGQLPDAERFDSALYIDTLEHIADDRSELASIAAHLAPGGHLVVLAPAHQWLYSPFDAAIGHYRRYTRGELLNIASLGLRPILARYMDAAGLLASLANRLLLRAANPTPSQIRLWDGLLVPVSRMIDPILLFSVGKSVAVVWKRQ